MQDTGFPQYRSRDERNVRKRSQTNVHPVQDCQLPASLTSFVFSADEQHENPIGLESQLMAGTFHTVLNVVLLHVHSSVVQIYHSVLCSGDMRPPSAWSPS